MELTIEEKQILQAFAGRRPDLGPCRPGLLALHQALVRCYEAGGKLLVCGNGGSHADALHIAGELCKSFERKRPLPQEIADRLRALPHGPELGARLEAGLPAIALGVSGSLKTAVENDIDLPGAAYAQEALALLKPGDVLLGVSTSGNARNCLMAMSVAKAAGGVTAALTGPDGGAMARAADVALKAPGASTAVVQEAHLSLYHALCALVEAHFYPEPR
jgi:D-sedoheptulose 7-phosphate isomerase